MEILLSKIMKEKNISYRKLEKLTGISKSSLHDITYDRISPRLNTLEIIAMALQTKISDLYDSPYKWQQKAFVCADRQQTTLIMWYSIIIKYIII